jgi:hypothetical protein
MGWRAAPVSEAVSAAISAAAASAAETRDRRDAATRRTRTVGAVMVIPLLHSPGFAPV